jgi:hypothetical protein
MTTLLPSTFGIQYNGPPIAPTLPTSVTSTLDGIEANTANLSPDALMAYCQSRLDSIDGQVQTSFAEQKKNAAEVTQIQAVATMFKGLSSIDQNENSGGASGTAAQANLDNAKASLQAVIDDIKNNDGDSPVLTKLEATMAAFENTMSDGNASQDETTSIAQQLSDAASGINSDSELQMVQLQSLMSQRQTAISLTTNLVQSLGDQESKIADNIGK